MQEMRRKKFNVVSPYALKKSMSNVNHHRRKTVQETCDANGFLQKIMPSVKNIALKDYSSELSNRVIDEKSPYVVIHDDNKKIIVKKTSWCWLLRKDYHKISSDRLERVKCPTENTNHIARKMRSRRNERKLIALKTTSNSVVFGQSRKTRQKIKYPLI